MGQLRYYDEDDIQKIADSTRFLIGNESKLKVSQMGDFLKNNEVRLKKVDSDYNNVCYKYYEDISPYRQNKNSNGYYTDYPSLTYEDGIDYTQYIFAGWFNAPYSATTTINNSKVSGPAYAKFIPASLLNLKVQLGSGTTMESPSALIRMISTIFDTNLSKLVYSLKVGNEESRLYTSTSIYYGLYAGSDYKFFAKDVNPFATYITAVIPDAIENKYFSDVLTMKAGYITLDNTIVLGHSYRNRIEDGITAEINGVNKRNLSVIVNCPEPITHASFDLHFNNSFYSYEGYFLNPQINANVEYTNTPGVGDPTKISIELCSDSPIIMNDSMITLITRDIFDPEQTKNPSKIVFKVSNVKLKCNGKEIFRNSVLEPSDYITTYTYVGESTSTYSLRRNPVRLNSEEEPIALFLDDKYESELWCSTNF